MSDVITDPRYDAFASLREALDFHFSVVTDPCREHGASWPCEVVLAFEDATGMSQQPLIWDAREGAYRIGQTARLIAGVAGEVYGPPDPNEPLRWAVSKTGGELTQDERQAIAAFMAERWRLWGEQEPMQVLAPASWIIRPN